RCPPPDVTGWARRHPAPRLFPYATRFRSRLGGPEVAGRVMGAACASVRGPRAGAAHRTGGGAATAAERRAAGGVDMQPTPPTQRSEEHTSELQSRENLVCRLLLAKKTTRG